MICRFARWQSSNFSSCLLSIVGRAAFITRLPFQQKLFLQELISKGEMPLFFWRSQNDKTDLPTQNSPSPAGAWLS